MEFKELVLDEEITDLIEYHNYYSSWIVLDLETTGLDPFTDKITDIVLTGRGSDSVVMFNGKHLGKLHKLKVPLVCHNFRFDFGMSYRAGVDLRDCGLFADTMLLDHLLDENTEHSLDAIVKRRYNDNYKEIFWDTYKEYKEAPKEEQVKYACKDVYYTRKAFIDITREIEREGIPASLSKHVLRLALSLYDTEIEGLRLDLDYLGKMGTQLSTTITALKKEMRSVVDLECQLVENQLFEKVLETYKTDKGRLKAKRSEFNFDSSQQLASLLYDQLRLPVQVNKKRKRTCDDAALEQLELHHPIIPKLREYRGYQKTYTSFIEGSLSKMRAGRIYPSFNINGTVTGRISSSNPNMQQLPTKGGVRGIYIPEAGYRFITCDYAQLEVTLAAHFSRDTNLLRIVYEGISQHDITAQGLGIDRATAKTINFALQYGAGVNKVQTILGCTQSEAKQALDRYWETYSGLRDFIKRCHSKIEAGEPLINPFGRRRRLTVTKEDSFWDIERKKRQGPNSLIQGTGGDITSAALYQVNDALLDRGLGKAYFSIHDEILITAKEDKVEEASQILQQVMINIGKQINLTVPLSVSCSKPTERWEK